MDILTHALFGALASRAVTNKPQTENSSPDRYVAITVAAIAAAFPDSDYFLFLVDPLVFLSEWHRSFTHSFVLLPLWTVLLTGITVLLFPGLRKHSLKISSFIALGLTTHIMLDLLTVYGTRIFYPFSNRSFSLGTTFVIDPYLTLIVIIGLIISFFHTPKITAMVFISFLCIYVLFQWQLRSQARLIGERVFSQGETTEIKTVALPQPFSPFHWRIITCRNDHYSTTLIDLAGISENLKRLDSKIPFIKFVSAYHDITNAEWE